MFPAVRHADGQDMPRILVVDDSADVSLALRFMLQRAGLDVVTADDGLAGLTAVAEHEPDLVVLDAGMPVMDGWEMLSRLREASDVPVIMLTARHLEHERMRGLLAGADDYMTKPFDSQELLDRITSVLRVRRGA
jgi:two-component system alkaline phosphatase synthesis response regulator PhoP